MPIRVLHCPTDTGGNAWHLSRGERELGVESDVLVFSAGWYGYKNDIDLAMNTRGPIGKAATLTRTLIGVLRHYDVVHFNFGESLFSRLPYGLRWLTQRDLPLLRAAGKAIVVTYQGCDVRQRSVCERDYEGSACEARHCGICTPEVDAERARRAVVFDRYAHTIFALNPDLLRVLPSRAEFLPYTSVNPRDWVRVRDRAAGTDRPLRIVHAPTSREIKGTRYVVDAVKTLLVRGLPIELDLVEGVPHAEMRRRLEAADVVVDQLLVGWYGGLAVEAMALGIPVVCYLREDDLQLIPGPMRADIPVISAAPTTLVDVLCGAFQRRDELVGVGRRSREYVERWHDPQKVAARTIAAYERSLDATGARRV